MVDYGINYTLAQVGAGCVKFLHKLPCFCPMNVENHTNYEHTQTHTRIEKIIPQKVAQNLNEPFKEKGNKNYDFIAFSDTKDALKMLVPSHNVGFKGRVS